MSVIAIIVAAGRGSRAGQGVPKQYRLLGGRHVLARTLEVFIGHPAIQRVLTVIHPDDADLYQQCLSSLFGPTQDKLLPPVLGGATRQASVRTGLLALQAEAPAVVLVHDAARPFVGHELISRAISAVAGTDAAVPGIMVTDTIKLVADDGQVVGTPRRESLRAIQTPQAFAFGPLLAAHNRAAEAELDSFTDDGALAEWAGLPVTVFEGDPANTKLTHAFDLQAAEERLNRMTYVTRLGTGFDVHAFTDGDHVCLGGVRVPHTRGVAAHSDGDVILHALTDALLGAIADGDIGVHFPPSDPQWRGASSDRFLAYAADRVRARGGLIDHLDVTLLCEAPRLGPHRETMRRRIAEIAGVQVSQVSLKATTTEKLGFVGRAEGLAAQAAATIRLPENRQ